MSFMCLLIITHARGSMKVSPANRSGRGDGSLVKGINPYETIERICEFVEIINTVKKENDIVSSKSLWGPVYTAVHDLLKYEAEKREHLVLLELSAGVSGGAFKHSQMKVDQIITDKLEPHQTLRSSKYIYYAGNFDNAKLLHSYAALKPKLPFKRDHSHPGVIYGEKLLCWCHPKTCCGGIKRNELSFFLMQVYKLLAPEGVAMFVADTLDISKASERNSIIIITALVKVNSYLKSSGYKSKWSFHKFSNNNETLNILYLVKLDY